MYRSNDKYLNSESIPLANKNSAAEKKVRERVTEIDGGTANTS
jgi:hypothetical protein